MVVRNGYHGHTQRGTDISHYKYNNERGQGIKSYIKEVPMPDTYRNIYPKSVKNIGKYSDNMNIYQKATPIHVRGTLLHNFYLRK